MTAGGDLSTSPIMTLLRARCRSCKAWGNLVYREEGKGLGSFQWVKASGTFSLNQYDEPSCACGVPVYRRKLPQGRTSVRQLASIPEWLGKPAFTALEH